MMSHKILPSLLALALVPASALAQAKTPARPNIVVIMADDLGYGDVGWHGGPFKTPNLDRLAKESIRLEHHYSLPVCSPTRSSLLTGRFNSRFGCTNPTNNRVLPFDTVTIAAGLRSVGYHTAIVGKWHLGSKLEWGPARYGFDHSYGSLAGGVTSYTHVYKKGEFSQTWHRNGKFVEEKGHVTDLITREAIGFIEAKRDGPFFLYVPYTAVHLPIDEPKEWQDLYPDAKDPAHRLYGACISHMDDGVAKIVKALERTGQRDNTLIVFLSDNGGSTAENNDTRYAGMHPAFRIPGRNLPFRGIKATLYEGGIRTPAFVNWKGRLKPGQSDAPMHVADWFPTLAGIAGYRPKTDLKWDGQDMWATIRGEKKAEPRPIYLVGPGNNSSALRLEDWMLLTFKNKGVELYDVVRDVGQEKNLAAQQPERVQEMQRVLRQVAMRDLDARVKE